MDIFLWASFAASSGVAVASSFISSYRTKHKVVMRKQTPAERLMEYKEFSRLLVMEVTRLSRLDNIPKEKINEILQHLTLLYVRSNLQPFSNMKIKEALDTAYTALHIAESVDRRYMAILQSFVEAVVAAVLRASGQKESIRMSMRTAYSLNLIAPGFRAYSGGANQIAEWKNEILKNDRKDMK